MAPEDYRRAVEEELCLGPDPGCRAVSKTHRSSDHQRQCPQCRRRWSFGRLRQQWRLLEAYGAGTTTWQAAVAAPGSGEISGAGAPSRSAPVVVPGEHKRSWNAVASLPTARKWFGAFRLAVAEEYSRELSRELRQRAGLFLDPGIDELVSRQAPGFRDDGGGKLGSIALVAGRFVVFANTASDGPARDALADTLQIPVERAELGEFFSPTPFGPGRPCGERVRARVRGGWRVAGANRRAAVIEAAAWEHQTAAEIIQMVFANRFDPDRT